MSRIASTNMWAAEGLKTSRNTAARRSRSVRRKKHRLIFGGATPAISYCPRSN